MMKAIPRSSVGPVVAGVLVVVATFTGCEEPSENTMADEMVVAEEPELQWEPLVSFCCP
jgi:hypothetical protein